MRFQRAIALLFTTILLFFSFIEMQIKSPILNTEMNNFY